MMWQNFRTNFKWHSSPKSPGLY